ncbi:helix-turn-helix transcriptional regulator [Brevibacterium pigmentatum]|uniref:helix-turn-helix transcriptional regulator n=1 Tax=Brevibacterium pigmentatum TaxID=1496080 RepID=UPI002B1BD33D|nr:helix-turn-helix transcriptional regulator [Brevibacterium pigmentatum]
MDAEVLGDLGDRGLLVAVQGDADDVVAELFRIGLWHGVNPSRLACEQARSDVPKPCISPLRVILNVARHDANMTFDMLVERSGVSRNTLLNISSGKFNGDLRTWLKLARAFGVSLDDLLSPVWHDRG